MAEYTYSTRKKITQAWEQKMEQAGDRLSDREKMMRPGLGLRMLPKEMRSWMEQLLTSGTYHTLSDIYRKELPGLVAAYIPDGQADDFYYILDQLKQFQMTAGWYRRSVRSDSYLPFIDQGARLLWSYARLSLYNGSLTAVLTGQVEEELYDYFRYDSWSYDNILAAQIDHDCKDTIRAVKDILLGENNTRMISHD